MEVGQIFSISKFFAMKILIKVLVLSLLVAFTSCINSISDVESIQDNLIPIYENGVIIGYVNPDNLYEVSEEDIASFIEKGWLTELDFRAHDCSWSDGYGGSINCDGGYCKIVQHTNPSTGQTFVGIMCLVDEVPVETGLYRPK
jgi:hypothetical protein